MLHQLGSLAATVGDRSAAVEQLTRALRLREQDGNASGAELTRYNLGQLIGEGGPPVNGGGQTPRGPGPWRPGRGFLLPGLIVLVVLIAAVAALRSSGSDPTPVHATGTPTNTTPVTSQPALTTSSHASAPTGSAVAGTPPPAPPAAVAIVSPRDGFTYQQGSTPPADYSCSAATTCQGPVDSGQPFASTPGAHTFTVTAKNRDGKVTTSTASYAVRPADTTPPTIVINSPKEGGVYTQGSTPTADYTCTDGGSGVATCQGPVGSGTPFDTSTPGRQTFTVTSTDNAGNPTSQVRTYTVVSPKLT
jgi:hypothetical protein